MHSPHRPPPALRHCPSPPRPGLRCPRPPNCQTFGRPPPEPPSAGKSAGWCGSASRLAHSLHSDRPRTAGAGVPREAAPPPPIGMFPGLCLHVPAGASGAGSVWLAALPALFPCAGWKGRWEVRPGWPIRPRKAPPAGGRNSARQRPPGPPHCPRRARGRHRAKESAVWSSGVPGGWPAPLPPSFARACVPCPGSGESPAW